MLLRLQLEGGNFRAEPVAQSILGNELQTRNPAAIRYRLRNISAVASELGAPTLQGFSPAERVGKNVRTRIKRLLKRDAGFQRIVGKSSTELSIAKADVLDALSRLETNLEDLSQGLALRGHNQPPELIDNNFPDPDALTEILTEITDLQILISQDQAPTVALKSKRERLLKLAENAAKWLGERLTKFTDAAVATAAPILVAKVTGVLPAVVDTIEALSRMIAS